MKTGIVHYDIGNLMSVDQAFRRIGADYSFVYTADEIESCHRLVLPGVGAFSGCSQELIKRDLWAAIQKKAATGAPLLGICVGMQMLFDGSEEFGEHAGLGLIKGKVKAIPNVDVEGSSHKIPHVTWAALKKPTSACWSNTVLSGVKDGTEMYFVHSYTGHPENESDRLADAYYGGHKISAFVQKENVMGAQFHPEKSGAAGLNVLENFIRL